MHASPALPCPEISLQPGDALPDVLETRQRTGLGQGYRFHHERRWRADFAHVGARVLIEIEGGIWVNGRHNRAAGFNADLEKYLAAGLAGWRVFRFGPDQITLENVERMAEQVRDEIRRFSTESTLLEK